MGPASALADQMLACQARLQALYRQQNYCCREAADLRKADPEHFDVTVQSIRQAIVLTVMARTACQIRLKDAGVAANDPELNPQGAA